MRVFERGATRPADSQLDSEAAAPPGRVPAVYLTSVFLWFFSVLLFRRVSKLCSINSPEGFDSNPGSPQSLEAHRSYPWRPDVPQPRG